MKLKKRTVFTFTFMLMMAFISMNIFAAAEGTKELEKAVDIKADKVWTIKFNKKLKRETVNNVNVKVEKVVGGKGTVIYPKVVLGNDGQSILVNAPTEGYTPKTEYLVTVTNSVMGEDGTSLSQSVIKKYTIQNQAIDESTHADLPIIQEVSLEREPMINGDKQKFNFKLQGEGKLQYRLFLFKFGEGYKEITTGYSKSVDGGTVLQFSYNEPLGTGTYKAIFYVKKANEKGTYEDGNTDFDNYKIVNFKALDKIITENITYMDYSISFEDFLDKQFALTGSSVPKYEGTSWINASKDLVRLYSKPENFLDEDGKYMFLKLNYVEGITEEMLKELLQDKGVLSGTEKAFLEASKKNNINPVYFIMHALHETGNGTSTLSKGVEVSSINGQTVTKKKTYNILGIKAEDDDPIRKASEYAYTQGWFDISSSIMGAAEYVSPRYINKPIYKDKPEAIQNTLYKMKWNPANPATYQYATDIRWAYIQSKDLKEFFDKHKEIKLEFEVPKFK